MKQPQTGRMATRSEKVMKELTPEEMTVLTNMGTQIQQILSMAGGQAAGQSGAPGAAAGTVAMGDPSSDQGVSSGHWVGPLHKPGSPAPSQVEGDEEEEDDEDEGDGANLGQGAPANATSPRVVKRGKAAKAIIVGDPDASTGSSEAEDRQEDLPEWDEENLDAVTKAILRMALGKGVRKSRPQNPLVAALSQVTKAVGSVAQTNAELRMVVNDILEGLGVAKGLEEAQTRVARERPIGTMPENNANVMKEFLNALASAVVQKGGGGGSSVGATDNAGLPPAERVRKGMSELVLAMSQAAGTKWSPDIVQD